MKPFKLIYTPFPDEIHNEIRGMVQDSGTKFTIVIDSRLAADEQQKTLRHELAHIVLNHHTALDTPLSVVEAAADDYADRMSEKEFSALMEYAL